VSWQQIQGHDAQRAAFVRAVHLGRLAHAYLFVGPPGIGKRSAAVELARGLLCEQVGENLEACGRCSGCKLVDAGTHPDFFPVARPETGNELPIDLIRELCQRFTLKAARGRGKVAIVDDADDLNDEAANCFLKTLEEPPPKSLLVLIGTTPERQLATIVSRCQVVRFAPLSESLVDDVLRRQGVEDSRLRARLVRLGRGSPGQALALADPALWKFRKELIEALLQPMPDSAALAQGLVHFVEDAGKEMASQRRRAGLVLRLLIEFFDDVLAVRLGANPRLSEPEEMENLRVLAQRVDPEKLLRILERCLEADVQIDRYIQLVLVLEALVDALGATLATT
jgi:DNA polymerase III subunit delta'